MDAQKWSNDLKSGKFQSVAEIVEKNNIDKSLLARCSRLAYLAPDIIEAIMEGRHPPMLTVTKLRKLHELPREWEE